MKNALVVILFAGMSICLSCSADKFECGGKDRPGVITDMMGGGQAIEHKLKGGMLKIPGYDFKLSAEVLAFVTDTTEDAEAADYLEVYISESPDKKHSVLQIGNHLGPWDLWLINNESKITEPLKFNPCGGHLSVYWVGNDVIGFFTGGMGYNCSQLTKLNEQRQTVRIEDMCFVDVERGLYLAGVKDGGKCYLGIGKFFEGISEKMELPKCRPSVEWQAMVELDAVIKGDKVLVCIFDEDMKVQSKKTYKPNMLKK